MRILVTGGAGYLGSVLCRMLLTNGYKVTCYDNLIKGSGDSLLELTHQYDFNFIHGDITNKDSLKKACKNIDFIIHLAGIVGYPACEKYYGLAKSTNTDGSKIVAELGIPTIYSSTGSVYGKVEGVCTEESPTNGDTNYAITKLDGEKYMLENNAVVYRFATVFGVSPNMRVNLLVNNLVNQAITDRALNIFEANANRTFIHIQDVARAFIFGINNFDKMKGQIYNCGSNDLNYTKRQVVEKIQNYVDCHVSYADVNRDLDLRDYICSYDKLNNLGFKCLYDLDDGIQELVKAVSLLTSKYQ